MLRKAPMSPSDSTRHASRTPRRRRLVSGGVAALGAAALLVSLAPSGNAAQPHESAADPAADVPYASRPDILQQVGLQTSPTGQEDPNYLLTTPASLQGQPYGGAFGSAAIYDNNGQVIWTQGGGSFAHMRQITFQGQPALAMFDRNVDAFIVLNQSYQQIASFSMQGYATEYHNVDWADDGSSVLLTSYNPVPYDLSQWGGPSNATVNEIVIQEIDTATGQPTFEWSSFDHIPIDETHEPLTRPVVDYIHTNSVAYDSDGNILMSGRHTSTIYKIDINSGQILWRFGGEQNDFNFSNPSDMPSYQHDASRLANGNLAAFDNGLNRGSSRGASWQIDEQAKTAQLVQGLGSGSRLAMFTGSYQETPNGDGLVNFGNLGYIAEFNGTQQVFTGQFANGYFSYWADRTDTWVGTPAAPPDVALSDADSDGTWDVAVSWNGATEVDSWRIEAAGEGASTFQSLATVEKTGFETDAEVVIEDGDAERVRVTALDADGKALGARTLSLTE